MLHNTISKLNEEDGHALPGTASLVGAAGAIALGIGAANGTGWLCVVGGIVAGVGSLAAEVIGHRTIDVDIYARLESLEGKK